MLLGENSRMRGTKGSRLGLRRKRRQPQPQTTCSPSSPGADLCPEPPCLPSPGPLVRVSTDTAPRLGLMPTGGSQSQRSSSRCDSLTFPYKNDSVPSTDRCYIPRPHPPGPCPPPTPRALPRPHLRTHDDEVGVGAQPVQEDLHGGKQAFGHQHLQLLLDAALVPTGTPTGLAPLRLGAFFGGWGRGHERELEQPRGAWPRPQLSAGSTPHPAWLSRVQT